ncbi:MAG: SDR family oxidoreductase [Planctomycetota bacterium]|nr:SDR family oxidoreductase [Planctomycetota bacterium]
MVTGAARRVGRAIALELARRGHDLVLTARTSIDGCRETAELCREVAPGAITVEVRELALESEESIRSTCMQVGIEGVDGIVHNASAYRRTPLDSLDPHDLIELYRVNAVGPLMVTTLLAEQLRRSRLPGGGSVVCLGDIHADGRPRKEYTGYLASKAALHQMVESLALELAPSIRVNGVAPGVVAFAAGDMTEEEERRYVSRIPRARSGTLDEAAHTVAWMLLDAHYVTGQVLNLCGGRSIR